MESHLGSQLVSIGILGVGVLHRTLHILANNQGAMGSVLVPPFDECIIIGCLIANLPIDLWHIVVKPAVVHPQKDVGI